ncbi:MAG: ABC transporter substrate-binding protein [Nitrosopumilaceae archaeon]|nr:ABC transporter substrate-binding protein [Nitrosopumilaceae archaeon]
MKYFNVVVLVLLAAAVLVMPAALADHAQVAITINPYHAGCTGADACYAPGAEVAVDVGGEIAWTNGDEIPRRIAGSAVGGGLATIDSGASGTITLAPGETYSLRLYEAGTYGFHDPDYPQITGTVTVQAPGDADDAHEHDATEHDDTYARTITVGGVFDSSGDWSLTGGEIKTAAEMAESDFNGFLRTIGADWRLDIIYEDSQTSGPVALEKVQSLNARNVKLLVGMALSSHLQVAYQYTANNDMLVLSCCSTAAHLAIDDHIFRLRPDDSRQAPAMNTMLQNAGIEVLYMVNRNDAWGDGFRKAIKDVYGGTFVEGVSYDPAQRDLSAAAALIDQEIGELIAEHGADKVAVFYVGFDKIIQLTEILENYENASKVRWFGSNVQADADQYLDNPASAEFFETTRFTAVKTVTPDNPIRQDLNERIREIYDREPSIYSHSAYDSVWLLGYAIHVTQSTDADTLRMVIPLVAERMEGSFGSLRLTDVGDVASEYYEVWMVRDGEWVREYDIANVAE